MNTALRNIYKICSMAVMLALVAGITVIQVKAAPNGIYLAQAQSHYTHPVTGQIEDSGGAASAVLGQSMTDSALASEALVEVDPQGVTYATIRLKLMDNIKNPKFATAIGSGSFSSVDSQLMQEDAAANSADYRIRIPDESAIIRCSMNVTAMGRDVIFYITLSDLKSGSGDFVTSVDVIKTPAVSQENTSANESADDTSINNISGENAIAALEADNNHAQDGDGNNEAVINTSEDNNGDVSEQKNDIAEEVITQSDNISESTASASGEAVTKVSDSKGLEEFDASGNQVSKTVKETSSDKTNPVPFIIIGVVVIAAVGCGVWFYRKRR